MSKAEGGFLDRWSRRKLEQRVAPAAAVPVPIADAARAGAVPLDVAGERIADVQTDAPAPPDSAAAQRLPTLADAERLTPDSDFKPFVARGVAPGVRNAAMKKLFADPHFNVMDGLDTYIDDYSVSDPIPLGMLRQMASAKFLNLFVDTDAAAATPESPVPADAPRVDADSACAQMLAELPQSQLPQAHLQIAPATPEQAQAASPVPEPLLTHIDHDHPDLRLQPDHAAAAGRPGRGPA